MTLLKEGKNKQVFSSDVGNQVVLKFNDKVYSSIDNREFVAAQKSELVSRINNYMFSKISGIVPHHYLRKVDDSSFLATKLDIMPVKVFIHNFVDGSLVDRKKFIRGEWLLSPFIEYIIDDGKGNDIYADEAEVVARGLLNYSQIDVLIDFSKKASQAIWNDFRSKNLYFVDAKISFGWDESKNIVLCDEITPQNCRIWLNNKDSSLDMDVFRSNPKSTDDLISAYIKLVNILGC